MGRVGRNELCPCGSGKKYKHCCHLKRQAGQEIKPVAQSKVSLLSEVEKIQHHAKNRRNVIKELGVFVLYANSDGNAWLLEIAQSDAVQLMHNGETLNASIEENPEVIEIDWSHKFELKNKRLALTPYNDTHQEVGFGPKTSQQLSASMRRIRKKCSLEQLRQVHVDS